MILKKELFYFSSKKRLHLVLDLMEKLRIIVTNKEKKEENIYEKSAEKIKHNLQNEERK